MSLINLLACGAGIGSGLVAARLSTAGNGRWRSDDFWRQLTAFRRLLLSGDGEDRLFREYLRLWPVLLAFTARKLAVGLTALAPMALAFGCLTLLESWLRDVPADGGDHHAWNSVDDWEFSFFVAACLASLVSWFASRLKT